MEHRSAFSTEAGLKFFLVGSFASVMYLLGAAMAYWQSGTLDLSVLALMDVQYATLRMSLAFLMKLAAAPFHWWAPDVYEGAPMEATYFMVILPKLMLFSMLLKIISICGGIVQYPLILMGVLSILMGMFGAYSQVGLKRFLSYSGIGHMGFMVLGLSSLSEGGYSASVFYLLLYVLVSLLSWSIVVSLVESTHSASGVTHTPRKFISSLTGLDHRGVAVALSFSMFSMAGLPPLAGFFAKMDVLLEMVHVSVIPALVAIFASVVSTYYYLRLSKLMFFEGTSRDGIRVVDSRMVPEVVALSGLFLSLFMFIPDPLYLLSISLVEGIL
jgi:NADH-quinone oxidoreductase subunit N